MGGLISGIAGAAVANDTAGKVFQQGIQNDRAYQLSAADALDRGEVDAGKAAMKGGQTVGQAQTALATSGVDTQSGSALSALADSRAYSTLDQLTIRNNAAREAWGYKLKGLQSYQQGQYEAEKTLADADVSFIKSATGGGGLLG